MQMHVDGHHVESMTWDKFEACGVGISNESCWGSRHELSDLRERAELGALLSELRAPGAKRRANLCVPSLASVTEITSDLSIPH